MGSETFIMVAFMCREKSTSSDTRGIELLGKKLAECFLAHEGGINHFPFFEGEAFFEHGGLPIFAYQFNLYGGGLGKEERFFAAVKIAIRHVGNMGLGIWQTRPPWSAGFSGRIP